MFLPCRPCPVPLAPRSSHFSATADARHWFDPGLVDVDCRHWVPYLTADELGIERPKMTLDVGTGAIAADVAPSALPS